jgi:hypothetical protein
MLGVSRPPLSPKGKDWFGRADAFWVYIQVVFTNQRGKEVQHKPSTLTKKESGGGEE